MYVVLLMKIMYKCNVEYSFLQAFSNETMLAQTIAQIIGKGYWTQYYWRHRNG